MYCLNYRVYRAVPGMTAEQYEAGLKNLGGFSTVEEFWAWLLALPPLGSLANKSSFHIMKDGHRPVWYVQSNNSRIIRGS